MEVVLADGSLIRTGMGALNDSKLWPLFRGGYGPAYDSIFNQSNFGIVTKLSLWASSAPEGFMSCHADFENETDLAPLVDTFRTLLAKEAIQNHPVIGNIPRAIGKRGVRSDFYSGPGAIPDSRLKELQKEFNCGFWDTNFGLYGPKEIIEANYKRCKAAILKIPGAKLRSYAYYPHEGEEFVRAEDVPPEERFCQTGVPTMMPINACKYRGENGGHISFSPVLPADGQAALDFYYTAKASGAKYGFDFVAGLHLYRRHLTHINMIYFDRTDVKQKNNANKLFVQLVRDARDAGYGEYRAHIEHMDLVAKQYDFGGGALMRLNEKIKDALDPNGILSPGKQGIWGKRQRDEEEERGLSNGVIEVKI
jgi:4-cresol dehydrogenase (hydroxylating)